MRFYLTIILFFTAICSAQSTRGRCGELILPTSQQNATYDANDYITEEAVTKLVRGEELIIYFESKSYSTKNQYQFYPYYESNSSDSEEVLFVKMIRGEEIIVCQGAQCYKGVPAGSYKKTNSTYTSQSSWQEPCRGVDDSRECRPSGRGH